LKWLQQDVQRAAGGEPVSNKAGGKDREWGNLLGVLLSSTLAGNGHKDSMTALAG
jgi:hypothetical protein